MYYSEHYEHLWRALRKTSNLASFQKIKLQSIIMVELLESGGVGNYDDSRIVCV